MGYGVRNTEQTAVSYVGQHEGVTFLEAVNSIYSVYWYNTCCPIKHQYDEINSLGHGAYYSTYGDTQYTTRTSTDTAYWRDQGQTRLRSMLLFQTSFVGCLHS
jgi:hypothetical protein